MRTERMKRNAIRTKLTANAIMALKSNQQSTTPPHVAKNKKQMLSGHRPDRTRQFETEGQRNKITAKQGYLLSSNRLENGKNEDREKNGTTPISKRQPSTAITIEERTRGEANYDTGTHK